MGGQAERDRERTKADETRERLAQAAVAAFGERGFHGTTTRDIAGAAGMSPAALYVHHRSKEELLHLISREGHEAALAVMRAARAGAGTPSDQLRRVVSAFAAFHARRPTEARVLNYELHALEPDHLAEIQALRHEMDTEIREIVAAGIAAGEFHTPDPRLAATAILSLGVDVARWYRDDVAWTPTDLGDGYADIALRIVDCRAS